MTRRLLSLAMLFGFLRSISPHQEGSFNVRLSGFWVAVFLPLSVSGLCGNTSVGNWPPPSEDLIFAWDASNKNIEVNGKICRLRPEGAARYGRRFDLAPGQGRFVAEGVRASDIECLNEWTLEAIVTPDEKGGMVMAFGRCRLHQAGNNFLLSLPFRNGDMQARFRALGPGNPIHLGICVRSKGVEVRQNGKRTDCKISLNAVPSERQPLGFVFGDNWEGRLKHFAFYRAPVDLNLLAGSVKAADIKRIVPAERLTARCKLVERTVRPQIGELGPYARALVYNLYEVQKVIKGEVSAQDIVVAHWSILDRKFVKGVPDKIGGIFELNIEPLISHPQLKGERRFNEISDVDAPVFYDIRIPELRGSE